jgi:hypothetical protein
MAMLGMHHLVAVACDGGLRRMQALQTMRCRSLGVCVWCHFVQEQSRLDVCVVLLEWHAGRGACMALLICTLFILPLAELSHPS